MLQRGEQAFDHREGQIRPGCIVDQYSFGAFDGGESLLHGLLTRRAARYQCKPFQSRQRVQHRLFAIRRDSDYERTSPCIEQRFDRMAQNRFAAPHRELFGKRLTGAKPLAGGNDYRGERGEGGGVVHR